MVIERDVYGRVQHRWRGQILALSEEYAFTLRACRPYRAKTKGKVERFNGYLKGSFITPLAATLKQTGLALDVDAGNAHVEYWITEVANTRIHATTKERPDRRLTLERAALLPLPNSAMLVPVPPATTRPVPVQGLQHPLSMYEALLEIRA